MALVEAAKILRKHLNPFVQYNEPGPGCRSTTSAYDGHRRRAARRRARAQAQHEPGRAGALGPGHQLPGERGITTVRDLVSRTEDQLLNVRNFGETTLKEVKQKLHEIGLHLGMRIPTRR